MRRLYKEKHQIQLMLGILGAFFGIYVAFTFVMLLYVKYKQRKTAAKFNTNKLHLQDFSFPKEVYRERDMV